MYQMLVRELGGPSALERAPLALPELGPHDVQLRIRAIGCNFADTLITRGKYQVRPELPFAPGAEAAGEVVAVGAEVSAVSVGDRALAIVPYGAYVSDMIAPEARVYRLPADVSDAQAVGLGLTYQTSMLALGPRGRLQADETLVVHAAAGGVGLAAVQIGAALGARVIGTAGTPEKRALAEENGASLTFDTAEQGWVDAIKGATGGGADVLYDPVGGDVFDGSTRCIRFGGRILVIGFASGTIPTVKINRVMLKNIDIVGVHHGPYFDHAPDALRDAQSEIFRLASEGKLRPVVSEPRPLEAAAEALDDLANRRTVGKVVLAP